MPSNTRNLSSAASYADCLALFKRVPEPTARGWAPNERPLGNTRQRHYRVEKILDRFSVVLYATVMAEYSILPDGAEQRKFVWDSRQTSSMFLWNVCGVSKKDTYETTDGRHVSVPLAEAGTATLVFENGVLNVERSDHGQTYKYRVCDDDRRKRKEFLDYLQVYLDAALVNVCQDTPEIAPCNYAKGAGINPYAAEYGRFASPSMRLGNHWPRVFESDRLQAISALHNCTASAWEYLHGKYLYLLHESKPIKPPTPEALEKYMCKQLLRSAGLDKGTEQVPQPKFQPVN